MKRFALLLCCLSALFVVKANDKPVTVDQLPAKAKTFIQNYFPKASVSYAKMDKDLFGKTYDVVFTDGAKLEFNGDGEWLEVDCGKNMVPAGIVPDAIVKYIEKNHSALSVVEIDRDRKGYDVKLSNGLKLEFDKKYQLVEIDD